MAGSPETCPPHGKSRLRANCHRRPAGRNSERSAGSGRHSGPGTCLFLDPPGSDHLPHLCGGGVVYWKWSGGKREQTRGRGTPEGSGDALGSASCRPHAGASVCAVQQSRGRVEATRPPLPPSSRPPTGTQPRTLPPPPALLTASVQRPPMVVNGRPTKDHPGSARSTIPFRNQFHPIA